MKSQPTHRRARRLITERAMTRLDREEAEWLDGHLERCPDCAAYEESTGRAIRALRLAVEMPDPGLVRATQRSVRLYAGRLNETEGHRVMLVVSVFLAAAWGALLQPYLWLLFGWLGGALDLPDPAWQAAFLVMWLVPGIAVALVLMHQRPGAQTRPGPEKGATDAGSNTTVR